MLAWRNGLAQLPTKEKVLGSSPRVSTNFSADLAQWIAQLLPKEKVPSSSLGIGTNLIQLQGIAQLGRAPRLGRGCRQFESGYPDHFQLGMGILVPARIFSMMPLVLVISSMSGMTTSSHWAVSITIGCP